MPNDWSAIVIQGGVGGVLLLVLWLIVVRGDIRTRYELVTEQDRRKRAEEQVDTLLPSVRALTAAVEHQTNLVEALADGETRKAGP